MSNENTLVPWDQPEGGAIDYGKYAEDRVVVPIDKRPVLHVVQKMSPEVDAGTAKPGEIVIRIDEAGSENNINLGSSFQAVPVARGTTYVWWDDSGEEDNGGRPLAQCVKGDPIPEGCDPKDLLWPKDGGNDRPKGKRGPVVAETHTMLLCPYREGEVGAPVLASWARGRFKTGAGIQQLLNLFNGPSYAAVLEFYTVQLDGKDDSGKPVKFYGLMAKGAGQLQPDSPLLAKLKEHHDANQPHLTPKAAQG